MFWVRLVIWARVSKNGGATRNSACATTEEELGGGLAAQGNFRSVDAENPGVATGGAQGAGHLCSGQKPKFHKALRDIGGEIDVVDDAVLAPFELSERDGGPGGSPLLLETQLHYNLSMKFGRGMCQ